MLDTLKVKKWISRGTVFIFIGIEEIRTFQSDSAKTFWLTMLDVIHYCICTTLYFRHDRLLFSLNFLFKYPLYDQTAVIFNEVLLNEGEWVSFILITNIVTIVIKLIVYKWVDFVVRWFQKGQLMKKSRILIISQVFISSYDSTTGVFTVPPGGDGVYYFSTYLIYFQIWQYNRSVHSAPWWRWSLLFVHLFVGTDYVKKPFLTWHWMMKSSVQLVQITASVVTSDYPSRVMQCCCQC